MMAAANSILSSGIIGALSPTHAHTHTHTHTHTNFPALFTDTSQHIRFLLFSFPLFPLFSCRFRAVDYADLCQLLSAR